MPSSAIWTWSGAWGSNPPDPACRAGALPENELRSSWGGRESNTERAPYQRAQVRPYRPAPGPRGVLPAREISVDHRGIEPSPQALIRRRRSTRSCGPPAGATSASALDGTGPGNRTHARPGCRPGAVSSWLAPRDWFICFHYRWSRWPDSNRQSPRPERGALTRLSHTSMVATEGIEPSRTAL